MVGGRLCYLLASTWEFDIRRDLPRHPCLELSYHSVQGLTQLLCRRLITMTKVRWGYLGADRIRRARWKLLCSADVFTPAAHGPMTKFDSTYPPVLGLVVRPSCLGRLDVEDLRPTLRRVSSLGV